MSDPETITEAAVERVRSLAQSWASLECDDVAAEVDSRLGHLILGMLDDAGNAPGGPGARLEAVEALAETWERPGGSLYYPAAGQAVLEALRGASTDVEAGWRERAEAAEAEVARLRALFDPRWPLMPGAGQDSTDEEAP